MARKINKKQPAPRMHNTPAKTPKTKPPFLHRALVCIVGWLVLLISICFFTATYDSAQVKLTLLQIGAVVLLTLWACLKISQRKNPFTRKNLIFLAPLLIYMGWMTLSFVCFPYKLEAAEEFVRLWFYAGISGLIACEFTRQDVQTLTKFIVASAWVVFGYGLLQIVNIFLPGADLLPWHGFFANRIFSTLANPNFLGAFIVCTSAIIGAEFLRTRKKALLVLWIIGLLDLIFTESKGAWLAYGAMGVLGTLAYVHGVSAKKHLTKWSVAAVACLILAAGAAGVYSAKRFQSVSFRAYTWLSAVEMVKDSPLLGTGPGSFKIVYPAYRRPQIFYIENAHNTETAHAENEYLEQAATGGIIGLALFLWLMSALFIGAYKNMRRTQEETTKYALLGYSTALAGLLIHGFVDISMHFASSGILLAVLMGALWALMLANPAPENIPQTTPKHPRLLWALRAVTFVAVWGLVFYAGATFYYVLRNIAVKGLGEGILFTLALATFGAVVAGTAVVYTRAARQTARGWVCGLLLISLVPCAFFWRVFLANHYYSLGVALVQMGQAHASLGAFSDAIKLNPFLSEYRQYRANVFAMTLNPQKRFVPDLGDSNAPRTDFERAQADFAFVFAHNPDHALLHHNAGQLYYTLGMRQLGQAQTDPSPLYRALAQENLRLAKEYLTQSLRLDPVNVNTYLLLINIALAQQNVQEAQAWADAYYKGPQGVHEEEFLRQHRHNPHMQALQAHIDRLRAAGVR